jgi:hypothetical protein
LADNEHADELDDAVSLERIWPAASLVQANPAAIRRFRLFVHCESRVKRERTSYAFRLQTMQVQSVAALAVANDGQQENPGGAGLQWQRESVEIQHNH